MNYFYYLKKFPKGLLFICSLSLFLNTLHVNDSNVEVIKCLKLVSPIQSPI